MRGEVPLRERWQVLPGPRAVLDGEGARLYGGRWNSPGRPVVYTSTTLSLAALEYLIHVDAADAPSDLVALTVEVPDEVDVERVEAAGLPAGWEQAPEPQACKDIGDAWLVAGRAYADTLGQGFILVVDARTGAVVRMSSAALAPPPRRGAVP